jgi:LPPG:FO 2-phospho-L-lactate transferase
MLTTIAGGVGASKLLEGLCRAISPEELSIIVNTGDDIELFGLYIAPDLDIVTYTLAGMVNPATGWGIQEDSYHCLDQLLRYCGDERWFNLGDRDLATHIFRTQMMRAGRSLSEVTEIIRKTLGVGARIIPMTDAHTPTIIISDEGELHFQEYLVRRRAQPRVRSIRFDKIETARPAPGIAEAILQAEAIIICPSNPLISIGPIFAVPGIIDLLKETKAPILAISPIVGGASLKGPSDRMMADLGMDVSAQQVSRIYAGLIDAYIIDQMDVAAKPVIEQAGLRVFVTDTVMQNADKKLELAKFTLSVIDQMIGKS